MSDKNKCIIRKIYCGEGKVPKNHSRQGTPYECLKRGYGMADWLHRKKGLSPNSLQQIPYVGEVYEKKFKKYGIYTISSLIKKVGSLTSSEKNQLLRKVFTKSDGIIDQKAFNSTVLFLHERGLKNLPGCKIVSE